MKFVALALVVLLAVGSQAASLQADAPSQLAHVRAVADVYMTQAKESVIKILDQLDDTPYKELKTHLATRMEDMHNNIKNLQTQVSPYTDQVVSTISDATTGLRESMAADIEALTAELEPMRAKLREVIERHMEEYKTQLEPIVDEYRAKHDAQMQELKTKLEPVIEELRQKIATNADETRAALMPIIEAVRAKLIERVESLKAVATPYVEEYKEHFRQAYSQAQGTDLGALTTLKEKLTPLAEEIKEKMQAMAAIITETFNKN